MLDLMKENWDVAIILDSCRFDFFEKLYGEYLDGGELEKKKGGSGTVNWLQNVFAEEYEDIVYVSGNPYINSLGVRKNLFEAKNKFKKIYDVWDCGWDEEFGTVPPKEVTDVALRARKEYPDSKMIVHYVQPHLPYRKDNIDQHRFGKLRHSIGVFIEKHLGTEWVNRFRRFFGISYLEGESDQDSPANYSEDKLKYLYEDNLKWVLSEVENLIDKLGDCSVLVTADHGEALGESGEYFHVDPIGEAETNRDSKKLPTEDTENPAVREVPCWRNT